MVFILDGNSEIRNKISYSICLRHLIRSRVVTNLFFFLRKNFFSFMRAHHVLSYHLYTQREIKQWWSEQGVPKSRYPAVRVWAGETLPPSHGVETGEFVCYLQRKVSFFLILPLPSPINFIHFLVCSYFKYKETLSPYHGVQLLAKNFTFPLCHSLFTLYSNSPITTNCPFLSLPLTHHFFYIFIVTFTCLSLSYLIFMFIFS